MLYIYHLYGIRMIRGLEMDPTIARIFNYDEGLRDTTISLIAG